MLLAMLALSGVALADDGGHPVTLWEVSGKQNTVYLMGSIHLLRNVDYPLPSALNAAYDDADVLIMEIDMDDLDPFAAQRQFFELGVLHDETTLQDMMGTELYQEALNAADEIDIPLDMLSKTEPWYAAMTIELMALNRIGFNPEQGIEMHFMSKAVDDRKPIYGLETIEQQIAFLDGLPLQSQREMLMTTLLEGAAIEGVMDDMIRAWRRGDIASLESELLAGFADNEHLHRILLTDRNDRWVEQIQERLDDAQDYLIIVGALHLIGDSGVPLQLQRLNIPVRQLSEPPTVR